MIFFKDLNFFVEASDATNGSPDKKKNCFFFYARPQNLPYTTRAPSMSEVSRGVGDMEGVGARRWWRGGGGSDGELIVSPPPSLTGTQPFAVGVRCAVDQRAVVSVSLLTDTESLRASGFWGASLGTLWAPHLPSAGMPG